MNSIDFHEYYLPDYGILIFLVGPEADLAGQMV